MSKVNLSVSIDDEHMHRFSEVVDGVKNAGMQIEQEMEGIGVITGSIDSEEVDSLGRVEGVSHVEQSRPFQIAPPDSDVQ